MVKKRLRGKIQGGIGLFILLVSEVMLFQGVEPFASWFYCFAWWAYILIVDSVIYELRGDSLIISRTREFLWLIPWSVVIWLVFELVNVVMKNWYYVNVIDFLPARWAGYSLAYATVLPGIFETTELLDALGLCKQMGKVKMSPPSQKWLVASCCAGVLFFITPFLSPRYFFPLIWLSCVFLLEPLNYWFGGRSLLKQWEKGNWQRSCNLLLAGLICGFFWEFWNYWAKTKWIYTVPFFQYFKLFEMPVLGYLGFPPFAVECYVLYNFICLVQGRRGWEREPSSLTINRPLRYSARVALLTGMLIFFIVGFAMIDACTVKSFSRMRSGKASLLSRGSHTTHEEVI